MTERRRTFRRAADRLAHEERLLLARALDILAGDAPAEAQLAELLGMVARVAGARRAAVLAESSGRRVAVAIGRREPEAAGRDLGRWLDANAPRPLAERAASGPAPIAVVRTRSTSPGAPPQRAGRTPPAQPATDAPRQDTYAIVAIPGVSHVHLGFELPAPADAGDVAARFPGALARHAAVALALVTARATEEAEIEALRAREAERATYVSIVAHELRTPLTGLGGYIDLLLDGRVDAAVAREFLERGRTIVQTMGELVGDLLELARLEARALRLATAPFSLADACSRVLDALAPIAAERGTRLHADLPSRLRTAVADSRRAEQVLTNLVGNALKFAPPGGVVELEARFEGQVALVAVRDDGPGIAAEDHDRVFQPFVRLSGQERVSGSGLGLPIARDLARAMAGDLAVTSVMSSGSTFVLALPAVATLDREVLAAVLARALEAEEVELEERAVLRAIRDSSRGSERARATEA